MENTDYKKCTLCPRRCGIDRTRYTGRCGVGAGIKIARADLHFWEEPCVSGTRGAGTVFFSGCQLGCVFCQNAEISHGAAGVEITRERLAEIFFELKEKGAHNIDLVTPDCFIPDVVHAIREAKKRGLDVPFICNCSGYETPEAIEALADVIDVWLPDFKYFSSEPAGKYSGASDYPEVAKKALDLMVSLRPECEFDSDGLIRRGVIIRHLLLPGGLSDSREALEYLYRRYGEKVWYSIMSQYTPPQAETPFRELGRRVTKREYGTLVDFACILGIEHAYIQDRDAASEDYIPDFNSGGAAASLPDVQLK